MKIKLLFNFAICVLILFHSGVFAEVTFNGFASITGGKNLSGETAHIGYDKHVSFKNESVMGLQATSQISDELSATAQILARGSDDFDVEFSWAYFSYEINESMTVRLGRMRIPFYIHSDYLDVRFSVPWVRPSYAMYSLPFSNYEGLSVINTFKLGSLNAESNLFYGSVRDEFFSRTEPTDGEINNFKGLSLNIKGDNFGLFLSHNNSKAHIPIQGLESVATALISNGEDPELVHRQLTIDDDKAIFTGIGIEFFPGNLYAVSEYAEVKIEDTFISKPQKTWYVSVGYNVGGVTPYVMYEKLEQESIIINGISDEPIGLDAPLFSGIPANILAQSTADSLKDEYSIRTVGVRYDLSESSAVKLEFNEVKNTIYEGKDVSLLSFSLDAVF